MLNIHSELIQKEMASIGANAFCVLLAISSHISPSKRTCFPSRGRIKSLTKLGDEAVRNAIKKLCDMGYLEVNQPKDEDGRFKKTTYRVLTKKIGVFIPVDSIEIEDEVPGGGQPHTVKPYTADPHLSISNDGSIDKEGSSSPATAEQSPSPIATKEKCTDVPPPPGFDEVWSVYGHKQQRADAIKAYKALKLQSDRHALLAGIPAYLAMLALPENSWRKQKLLGAFIRGRMWEDDFSRAHSVAVLDISDDNRALMDFTYSDFPNVVKLKWLTDEQFAVFKERKPEMFGNNYAVHASPIQLKAHIRAAFSELNSNSFKRSQYQDVYSYLCDDLKKRIYGK